MFASTRLTSFVWRWAAVLLVAGLAADSVWAFFPSLPPTNRTLPGGGGPPNQTVPGPGTPPPGSPPPPPPPGGVGGNVPPPSTPPGNTPPPPPPVIPPGTGVTPPTIIPEIDAHGLAAGLGIALCGILMLTDRKRRRA